ncbi:MAG: 50S ribosomal protein L25 [Kiritimatiellales bacterium]
MSTKIAVKSRDRKGSAASRRLRREGWIPGVIYSKGREVRAVSLPKHEFEQMLHRHASEQVMIPIQIDGQKEESVLLKEIQRNALSGGVKHVDMQEVAMDKKLRVSVLIELVGEAEGAKLGGILEQLLHEIEIECFPADIPEQVKVDVSAIKLEEILTVEDIPKSDKYKILEAGKTAVATVYVPRAEEETVSEDKAADDAAEPEVIREKKDEE